MLSQQSLLAKGTELLTVCVLQGIQMMKDISGASPAHPPRALRLSKPQLASQ